METTGKLSFSNRILLLVFALVAGMACASFAAGSAYAAENAGGGQDGSADLAAQYTSFTTATTAPDWAPTNSKSSYEVYSNYLFFSIGADGNLVNYNMYMDICPVGAKWSTAKTYKFGQYVQSYTIKGLKPNKKYKTRLYYGINENVVGPYSKAITFRTGPKQKLSFKSVSIKTTKFKKTKKRAYNMNFLYWWRHPYTYYEYSYNLKTTFTFKKIPKYSKFILVKFTNVGMEYSKIIKVKKGKKKYSVTMKMPATIYNPHKAKSTISIATYQNKTWKGYSKLWSASRKIKK